MVTYTSTRWANGSGSPLNATNLNNIEQGIDALVGAVNTQESTLGAHGQSLNELTGRIATNETNTKTNADNIVILRTNLSTLDTKVGENTSHISALEGTVGNATTGLVKRVTTLESDSATKVELKSATDRIGTIESTIPTLATDGELASLDATLSARIADAEQDIIALQNSSGGGGASTWEDLSGKPSAFNPTSHANGDSSVYGAATTSLYGHVKISNGDVANTSHANGLAAGMDHTHSDYATKTEATTTTAGLLSASDKTKLDGIATGADKTTIVNTLTSDSVTAALSAAQGKALKTAIDSLTGDLGELGGGDMLKAQYDTNNNGYVDNADNATKFDGHSVSEFSMDGHKHEISNVNNLQTELNNKADKEHTHDYASRAFKSIVVGGATITADDHQDSLELVAGSNITLTGDTTNDKITIAAKDTTYSFTNKAATLAWGTATTIATVGGTDITVKLPSNPNTDTKNTAGSTNSSKKLFLIGAESQAANPQTYSHDTAYVGTDGCLYSNSTKVSVDGHSHFIRKLTKDDNLDTLLKPGLYWWGNGTNMPEGQGTDSSSTPPFTNASVVEVISDDDYVTTQRLWRYEAAGYVAQRTLYGNGDNQTILPWTTFYTTDNPPPKTTLADLGITSTATELNYTDGVTSKIQTQLDAKLATASLGSKLYTDTTESTADLTSDARMVFIKTSKPGSGESALVYKSPDLVYKYVKGKMTGAISTGIDATLTGSRALITNSSGKLAASSVTSTQLGYLSGASSNIQTQLDTLAGLLTWTNFD